MNSIPIITCPLDCLASFHEIHEYDHPMIDPVLKQNAVYDPIIVDIGANVGAFTIWACERWKKSIVNSFEPNPELISFLEENTNHCNSNVHRKAIGNPAHKFLNKGRNKLCTTVSDREGNIVSDVEMSFEIEVLPPERIGYCNIIKMDCEGSEGYICEHLTHIPEYLVLEYHSDELMHRCLNALKGKMVLAEHKVQHPELGIMKFFRI